MRSDASFLNAARPMSRPALAPRQEEESRAYEEAEEANCPAFGFLRGIRDRAAMIEFRFKNGNTASFAYGWLGQVRFNPSVGMLLKFTGDEVTLVLIAGSNLDAPVSSSAANLTDRGIAKHRVTFVREMDEEEARRTPEGQPTVDQILIGGFESAEEQREWLQRWAPAFLTP